MTKKCTNNENEENRPINVLVGTFRKDNADWIKQHKFYNLPLPSFGKVAFHENIRRIVLITEGCQSVAYEAKFRQVIDIAWLKENGYKVAAADKAHGLSYALYELGEKVSVSATFSDPAADVFVSSQRCPNVKIDASFYTKPYPKTGGKSMPYIFDKLKPYFKKWHSATTFNPVQLDFLDVFDVDDKSARIGITRSLIKKAQKERKLTCVEICAGAGGQAIGLERAGFSHVALVEYESEYCDVLRNNNPDWNVICADVRNFDGRPYEGVDLLAGGVPCPPFSVASKQLGAADERDLFPEAIRLIGEIKPKAVMIENVRGLLDPKFEGYRNSILNKIDVLGYDVQIKLLHANDYGVPQIRPRVVIVGIKKTLRKKFNYPAAQTQSAPTVGEAIGDLMAANGWKGVEAWKRQANSIAPTIVGGSKKHGGPDLGPTRARRAWAALAVDGLGVANEAPARDFVGNPKLTKEMIAVIQGFPREWVFGKKKTAACRMIGNAFPPPVAMAVGQQIMRCLNDET